MSGHRTRILGRKVNHEKSFRNRIPLHSRASTQCLNAIAFSLEKSLSFLCLFLCVCLFLLLSTFLSLSLSLSPFNSKKLYWRECFGTLLPKLIQHIHITYTYKRTNIMNKWI